MNNFLKTLSVLTIASFAGAFTACGDESVAGVTEEADGLAELSSSSDADDSSSSKKQVSSSSKKRNSSSSSKEEEKSSSSKKEDKSSSSKNNEPSKFSGKISGVSQKGPFLVGSSITLHEIDGASFDLSGRTFVDKIKNDKGEFELSFRELSSNYALLIADGYYRNENTGKKSTSPIKLNAISDLADRKTVNVNLLTHLEFDRVKYLALSKGVEYGEAKAQAEKEILEAFGMKVEKNASAEDLTIFGESENDAALLALSVLMQGTSGEGAFSERLALVAQDLEEDGTIDDEQMKTDIADEVALMDLKAVRKNIEGWKVSSTVPEFEKFVESYWTTSYGIGACTDKDIAKTAKNTNKLSKNFEKSYVCDVDGWREMSALEEKLGTCTSINEHEGNIGENEFYACVKSAWKKVNRYGYDTLTIVCEKDGEIVHSELNDAYYVCKDGKIAAPTFDDLSIEKEFTADIWNGTKDSKVKVGETEYEALMVSSDRTNDGSVSIFNSNGEKITKRNKDGGYVFPEYDEDGVSSTLQENGLKYSYSFNSRYAFDDSYVTASLIYSNKSIDVSDWEGVCVVYASSAALHVSIMGEWVKAPAYPGTENYKTIPASAELTVANLKWEDFAERDKGGSYEKITKNLNTLSLYVERVESWKSYVPDAGSVYIAGIGKYNGCSIK